LRNGKRVEESWGLKMTGESGGNMREQLISGKVMIHYSDVKVTSVMVRVLDGRLSLLFHAGPAAIKLPSAEASKRAQCTSPGQYAPYIKGIMKTP